MSRDRIKVLCRVRPFPDCADEPDGFRWSDRRIIPLGRDGRADARAEKGYLFQRVLPPEARNEHVYEEIADAVAGAAEGVNATVLAYGHTSAGKTHTMVGTADEPGLISRAMESLMEIVAGKAAAVTVSYFEVYMEKVYDLLSGDRDRELDVTGADGNVAVGGLVAVDVAGIHDCLQVLAAGNENRRRTRTNLNEHSSRSHTIFQADVRVGADRVRHSQLRLVDLAGSECSKTAGTSGGTQREGAAINKSLLALTNVIYSLAAPAKGGAPQHIPYRDAKLTRILQNSLGGNSSTRIICCVGAKQQCYEDTLSTLMFADRARVVFNTVKRNESDGTCSVPWNAVQELIGMYQHELDQAEQREQALREAHKKELYTAVTFMLKEHNAEGLLWRELDYVAQKKCEALTSDVHRAMAVKDQEVRAEQKKHAARLEQERAAAGEAQARLHSKLSRLQAEVQRAGDGGDDLVQQLRRDNEALRARAGDAERQRDAQAEAHLQELMKFQSEQEAQQQAAVQERDREIARLRQRLEDAPAPCLSAQSSMASIPLGTARGADVLMEAACGDDAPLPASIKRKLEELHGMHEAVRSAVSKRARLSTDPLRPPAAVRAFDEAMLAAMPKVRVASQSACLPPRKGAAEDRDRARVGKATARTATPTKRDGTPVKSRARAATPTSEKRSHTPKSVTRGNAAAGRYGTPVRTPVGKTDDGRVRRALEPRGQAAATPPSQRHPTPTSAKKTLFSTGEGVRKRSPPKNKRRVVSPPPHERREAAYPF